MTEQNKTKSNVQLVIDALMTGDILKSREIAERVSQAAGKEVKIQDIASMLAKLTDGKKCDLGFFIAKTKDGNTYDYQVVEEARRLSSDQAYDLARKIGKNRFTLEQAISEFPELKKYVDGRRSGRSAQKQKAPKTNKRVRPAKPSVALAEQKAEVNQPQSISKPATAVSNVLDMEILATKIVQKIAEVGGLQINVNVSVKFG
jgi:hypothetical protein